MSYVCMSYVRTRLVILCITLSLVLFQIEQEVEGIRDAHRMLETSTVRREGLEKALRVKLEQEIWRLKEEGIRFKGLHLMLVDC